MSSKRLKIIKKYVTNKDVLDIGSAGQTSNYNLWKSYSQMGLAQLTGIDLDSRITENDELFGEDVSNKSTAILNGNMENYKFGKKFDTIVAGDVLEHVDNQGLFLDNINHHLKEDGYLVITTPNAKWPTVFLKPNPTHTIWHDKYTIERILDLHGFKIVEFHYYRGNKKRYLFPKNILAWRQGMIVVCSKKHV